MLCSASPMRPGFEGATTAAFFVCSSSATVAKLARVFCAVCASWRLISDAWCWAIAASRAARWLSVRLGVGEPGAQLGDLRAQVGHLAVAPVQLPLDVLDRDVVGEDRPERGQPRERGLHLRDRDAESQVRVACAPVGARVDAEDVPAPAARELDRTLRRRREVGDAQVQVDRVELVARTAWRQGRGVGLPRRREEPGRVQISRHAAIMCQRVGGSRHGRSRRGRSLALHSPLLTAARGEHADADSRRDERTHGHEHERRPAPREPYPEARPRRLRLPRRNCANPFAKLGARGRLPRAQLAHQGAEALVDPVRPGHRPSLSPRASAARGGAASSTPSG